ncbi:uncharacterized protein N7506_005718 [Penicillium brevicompactum]|uniref:uncharacterized protein n=1 Tax=Penicillium brevicompactum TaxID=5074 RepID=UPI00254261C4|nr:uncharacterized protein N7506_005718 [Penicillium brevicompactum]KAJ5335782.1 hypothetical protein N7506_005718 [Penicillium brevicompactum]
MFCEGSQATAYNRVVFAQRPSLARGLIQHQLVAHGELFFSIEGLLKLDLMLIGVTGRTSRRCSRVQSKPRHLSPAELAQLDDIALDLLIDRMTLRQVNFPATTRKSSTAYLPRRPVRKRVLSKILGAEGRFDIHQIHRRILQIACLEGSVPVSGIADERFKWFSTQLKSYLQIYNPKCPFQIAMSEHLPSTHPEAAVFATRAFTVGEPIQFLSGVCVPLTKEHQLQLEKAGKDFSILQSPCSQALAMFLGPARAIIVPLKDIHPCDEITVFYAKDYFGENNQHCLCRSCARARSSPDGC